MSHKKHQRKIKNFVIMKNVQLKIAITNMIYMLVVTAVFILSVLSPFYYDILQSDQLCRQYFSANIFLILLERLSLALAAVLFLAFVHQILITHKLCGPLVNLGKTIKKISQGDFTRKIYLRRYDFLNDEASRVNEALNELSKRIAAIKEENNLLISTLDEMTKNAAEIDGVRLKSAVKSAGRCQELLAEFKLTPDIEDAEKQTNAIRHDHAGVN